MVERTTIEDYLRQPEGHVASGKRNLAKQRRVVADLGAKDTMPAAPDLPKRFEERCISPIATGSSES
jgi:hypothetical protein